MIRRHYSGMPRTTRHPRKTCRECHAPATHEEVEQRPTARLRRDGVIERYAEPVTVYWCAEHTGIKP